MSKLRFKVHAIIQLEERGLTVEDIRTALANGEDIEARPDEDPYPARLVLGLCRLADDEIIVETAYQPNPALWAPGLKTRRTSR